MFDVARLRRLDALFAERVMGVHNPGLTWPLPEYTRSLDAAWEGIRGRFDILLSEEVGDGDHHCETDPLERFSASVLPVGKCSMAGDEEGDCHVNASHPAEALVLACLRALGVEESELQ